MKDDKVSMLILLFDDVGSFFDAEDERNAILDDSDDAAVVVIDL